MASDSGKVYAGPNGSARAIVDVTSQGSNASIIRVRYILYNETATDFSSGNNPIGWSIDGTRALDASGTYTFSIPGGSSATIITQLFTYLHNSNGTTEKLTFLVSSAPTNGGPFGTPPAITVDITPPRILQRPSEPGKPYLGNVTSTSLHAHWAASSNDGGTPITDYALRRYVGYSASGVFADYKGPSLARNVTGLTPGETYTFTTLAQNAVGWGPESLPTTITLTRRPDPPRYVDAENVTHVGITIKWSAPLNAGGLPITNYLVRRYTGPPESWITPIDTTVSASSRSLRIDGLTPGTQYTFLVFAKNSATDNDGYSNPSEAVTVWTRAGYWVFSEGTWRRAVPYVRRNGVWTYAVPYVRTAGVWKITN